MRTERRAQVALLAVVVVAAGLRFSHLAWDGLHHTHPDERYVLFVASSMRLPDRAADLLRPARSTLNPFRAPSPGGGVGAIRPYSYGHLPLYAMLAARPLASPLLRAAYPLPFDRLTLVGRGLSALYDTLTVLLVGLLARRLYDSRAAWLAAAFAALAVLHIQQSHFATVDTALTLFVTLALYFMARGNGLLAGLCAGLALGSKVSALPLLLPLAIVHIEHGGGERRVSRRLWFALAIAGLAFALTNPYALLELPLFARDIATQAALVRGRLDVAFVRQYAGTFPLWYFVAQQGRWGLGWPLMMACYAGLGWATWSAYTWRDLSAPAVPLLLWSWLTLLIVGTQFVKFPRYLLPLTPVLFVFAAGWLNRLGRLRAPLAALVLLPTALNALAFWQMYAQPHPWLAASEWIYDHLPPGTVLAVERGDDALPLDLNADGEPLRAALSYDQRPLDPYTADQDLTAFLADLAASDYLVLASNRLYGTLPRLEGRYPLAASMYRHLFAGDLGFEFERAFSRYPALFGLPLVDDTFTRPGLTPPPGLDVSAWHLGYADESFTVYDHPLVLVFRNQAHLSAAEMQAIVVADG